MKELDQGYEFTKAQLAELIQLRQRVKELEYEESKSADMAHKNMQLWMEVSEKLAASEQRVKELEELLSTREDDLGIERHWVKTTSEKLAASQQRVAELEAENINIKAANIDCVDYFNAMREDLAASQAHNLRLRSALDAMVCYSRERCCGLLIADEAIAAYNNWKENK